MEGLIFTRNSSSSDEISSHLHSCEGLFFPELSSRVNIVEYAVKIRKFATTYEAFLGSELVGLVAVYENLQIQEAFITSVSTLEGLSNQGVAKQLIANMIDFLAASEISTIKLEVDSRAVKALKLYSNAGFHQISTVDSDLIVMCRKI